MKHSLTGALAVLLAVTLVAPSAFFIASPQVHAQIVTFEVNPALVGTTPIIAAKTTFSALKDMLNLATSYTNTAANVAQQINSYVLMPLAFVMSGNLLKMMTAGIIAFVAGGINGTGAPQFVQNLQGHLQIVSDTKANAFFAQFSRNSNSPFAGAITSSLRTNYLQQTSMAGFFSANRNTLPQYSSNQNAYLAGDWSQGGIGAWFALTTQDQNNPYMLYQNSNKALATMVTSATDARQQELSWGQGMLSWCDEGATKETVNTGSIPKVACIDADGNDLPIRTPGSTIKAYLDRALGSAFGKLEGLGQLGPQVGNILGNIAKVINTIGLAQQIMGGTSGGLSGVIQSGPGGTSVLTQYRNDPGFLGVTPSNVYQSASTLPSAGSDKLSIISQYESAWNSIRATAVAASTTVARLATVCAANATNPSANSGGLDINLDAFARASATQAAAARAVLSGSIASVFAQSGTAFAVSTAARAMVAKVQSELNSSDPNVQSAGIANMATLQTMTPTMDDLGQAQQEAQTYGAYGTTASPAGSLTVTGGSLIDHMSLIATNAQTLLTTVCAPATYVIQNSGGGD